MALDKSRIFRIHSNSVVLSTISSLPLSSLYRPTSQQRVRLFRNYVSGQQMRAYAAGHGDVS